MKSRKVVFLALLERLISLIYCGNQNLQNLPLALESFRKIFHRQNFNFKVRKKSFVILANKVAMQLIICDVGEVWVVQNFSKHYIFNSYSLDYQEKLKYAFLQITGHEWFK